MFLVKLKLPLKRLRKVMANSSPVDFNELGRIIAAELDSGVESINTDIPWSNRFHITSMRVRLGQSSTNIPEDNNEDNNEDNLPDKPQVFLLDNYLLAEKGWMFELEMAPGLAPTKIKLADKPPFTLPAKTQHSAMEIFGKLSISNIKGADEKWTQILAEFDIETIQQLAAIKHETLIKIIHKTHKKYPLNLATKARLLYSAIPFIPSSPVDQVSLYSLLEVSTLALRKQLGESKFSVTASEKLHDLLLLLYTVLDTAVLEQHRVYHLRTFSDSTSHSNIKNNSDD